MINYIRLCELSISGKMNRGLLLWKYHKISYRGIGGSASSINRRRTICRWWISWRIAWAFVAAVGTGTAGSAAAAAASASIVVSGGVRGGRLFGVRHRTGDTARRGGVHHARPAIGVLLQFQHLDAGLERILEENLEALEQTPTEKLSILWHFLQHQKLST